MKKLLTMMTAVALGTCAWATESSAVTLLNENFNAWANGTDLEYMTALPEGLWSYSGTLAENELKVVAEAEGDNALALNTGSKVLNAKFAAEAQTIPAETGYYFNATVTFKDPSDTLPTLGESDKFALVVLDNIESVDAATAAGVTVPENMTNLWVIAHHETEGKRAYKMNVGGLVNLTESWLDVPHTIVVKAYDNVMASGTRAGFLLMVDNTVCTVAESYAIENNIIDFGEYTDGASTYLGYDVAEISLSKRYTDKQLLLSIVTTPTLASVDFQGQGEIDDVSLAMTGADFGPDQLTLNVVAGTGVTLTTTSFNYDAVGDEVTISFTLANANYKLSEATKALGTVTYDANDATKCTLVYTTEENVSSITISAFLPAAYVGTTPYPTFADALTAVTSGGTLTLMGDVDTYIDIKSTKDLILDLNGNTVADIYNEGTLTIMDSSVAGTGTVSSNTTYACSVDNSGDLTVLGGRFEATILNDNGTVVISGGKFKVTPDATFLDDDLAFSETADTDGYYSVVEASSDPLPALPENATDEDVTTALGEQVDTDVTANVTTVEEYNSFKAWADATTGGAAAVVASQNAWLAYALDAASLLTEATKVELTDADITVESFAQDTTDGAADGQFTLEISLKNITIGAGATKANLLKILDAEGTTDLGTAFAPGAVNKDVAVNAGKAKFTVSPKVVEGDTKPSKFFYKAKIK